MTNENTANAVRHFGAADKNPVILICVTESDMEHSDGMINIGCHTINPKNIQTPERITIDIDPEYPDMLLRITELDI